jgi:hypothetical protein
VPTGVVEHEVDRFPRLGGHFFGHHIEENLKHFGVAMVHNQTNKLTAGRLDRTDNIPPQMAAKITLRRATAALDPAATWTGIALEAGFVSEENSGIGIIQSRCEFDDTLLAFGDPFFLVGRFWHGPWDAACIVVFVEVTDQGAIRNVEGALLLEPTAKFDGGPMKLASEGRVIDEGENLSGDRGGRDKTWSAASWTVGYTVDALLVEARDPKPQATFAASAVAQNEVERDADE